VARLAEALKENGLRTRVAWTLAERAELVEEARRDPDCRCLVAAGGDGTVADLVNERPGVPITVLPAGTENLFARHFGIGPRPEALAGMIASGQVRRLDLGRAGGRLFTLMAGIGFDADVVSRHHAARVRDGLMRTTHRAAYVEPVLRSSFCYRFPELSVAIEEPERGPRETLVGTTAFLFNLPRYALGLPIAPTARDDDGLLDLVVFRDPGPFRALRYLWLVFRGLHLRRPGVYHRRVRRVSIRSTEDVPVQLDGDPAGMLLASRPEPWTAEVVPGALDVVVPAAEVLRPALAGA
jgi:diacylglycerol kinase family enzyme